MKETGNLLLEIDKMVLDAVNNGAKLLLPTENLFPKSIVEAGVGGNSTIILFCFVDNNFYLTSSSFDYPLDRFVAVAYGNSIDDVLYNSTHVSIETLRVELNSRATSLEPVVDEYLFQYIKSFKALKATYIDDKYKRRSKIIRMIPLSDKKEKLPYNKEIRAKFIKFFSNYFLDECAEEFYETFLWCYNQSDEDSIINDLLTEILSDSKNMNLFFSNIGYPINHAVADFILLECLKTNDDVYEFLKGFVNYHNNKGKAVSFNVPDFSTFADYLSIYFSKNKSHLKLFKDSNLKFTLDFISKNKYGETSNCIYEDKLGDYVYEDIHKHNPKFDVKPWAEFIEEGILEIKGLSEELAYLSDRKIENFYVKIFGKVDKELCSKELLNYYIFLKIYDGISHLVDKDKSIKEQNKNKNNRSLLSKKIKSISGILDGLRFLEKKNFI